MRQNSCFVQRYFTLSLSTINKARQNFHILTEEDSKGKVGITSEFSVFLENIFAFLFILSSVTLFSKYWRKNIAKISSILLGRKGLKLQVIYVCFEDGITFTKQRNL